ncbi:hypothetical protein F2P56_007232 [Juglans regia]|uniref:Uncharacterized protein n=1 Tax=Juglans regia TaxID=51240 RepID=A0A833XR39_JUGRE|nr:hypothetical protein F2P56_007232 [Juglans regia]
MVLYWPSPKPSSHLIESTSIPEEPHTYTEASKFADWCAAMASEFEALQHNHTWILVPPHPTQNILGSKWAGLDYSESFSPIVKPVTIQLLLSIVVYVTVLCINWMFMTLFFTVI